MLRVVLLLLVLATTSHVCTAQTNHFILWRLFATYDPMTIDVGDTVEFDFTEVIHTVVEMRSIDCTFFGERFEFSPAIFQFDTPGTFYYGCDVSDHCEQGMAIEINVVGSAPVDTVAPTPSPSLSPTPLQTLSPTQAVMDNLVAWELRPYDVLTIEVGNTVTFVYDERFHTVVEMTNRADFDNCVFDPNAPSFNTSPTTLKFDTEGTFFIGCDVGTHCEVGMKIEINVVEALPDVPTTSPVPEQRLMYVTSQAKCDDDTVRDDTIRTETVQGLSACRESCLLEPLCEGMQWQKAIGECILLSKRPSPVANTVGFKCGRIFDVTF